MSKATALSELELLVQAEVSDILSLKAWTDWYGGRSRSTGDLILLNNSFVYRDKELVTTVKNRLYLSLQCTASGSPSVSSLKVAETERFDGDFSDQFETTHISPPPLDDLPTALTDQASSLGQLVFVLIGAIDDTIEFDEPLTRGVCPTLRFSPKSPDLIKLDHGPVLVISNLARIEDAWHLLESQAPAWGLAPLPADFDQCFAHAVAELKKRACCKVSLPAGSATAGSTLIGRLTDALKQQCDDYSASLVKWQGHGWVDSEAQNNVMRIAYNFANDVAVNVIPLLVSICDLKPAVLWCTIGKHYRLAEAFRNLPWERSRRKPQLKDYRESINGARNHAFHDFFQLDRPLDVDLSGVTLKASRMRLFPLYRRNLTNELEYEDREIAKLLLGFHRAEETAMPTEFWKRNLDVLLATHALLTGTHRALSLLWEAAGP